MKKIVIVTFITGLFLFFSSPVFSQEEAGRSARINYIVSNTVSQKKLSDEYLIKRATIRKVLERYDSPLVENIDKFISVCQDYEIDCYLLPAIAGVESTFGRFIYENSYNPFGWGGGTVMFHDFDESITTVGRGLNQYYFKKGASTVEQIASIYASSSTWAFKVKYFINKFELEEQKQLQIFRNHVEL